MYPAKPDPEFIFDGQISYNNGESFLYFRSRKVEDSGTKYDFMRKQTDEEMLDSLMSLDKFKRKKVDTLYSKDLFKDQTEQQRIDSLNKLYPGLDFGN